MKKVRKLYVSPNGDRSYIVFDPSAEVFVRHEANIAAGGTITNIERPVFLSSGRGPQQQELLRLIGTLVTEHSAPEDPGRPRLLLLKVAEPSTRNWPKVPAEPRDQWLLAAGDDGSMHVLHRCNYPRPPAGPIFRDWRASSAFPTSSGARQATRRSTACGLC
jgi:hypothetical protein